MTTAPQKTALWASKMAAAASRHTQEPVEARIGPNSVLQLAQVVDLHLGNAVLQGLLAAAGMQDLPSENGLMPESPAARLHQTLRQQMPEQAAAFAREAGERTGDYILAHRIPAPAQRVLRALPARLASPILARAIGKHAWTFAGSGVFRVLPGRPMTFELYDNPVVRGESSPTPLCDWHAAVFQRLFNVLVSRQIRCTEITCCAMGASACRFSLQPVDSH